MKAVGKAVGIDLEVRRKIHEQNAIAVGLHVTWFMRVTTLALDKVFVLYALLTGDATP